MTIFDLLSCPFDIESRSCVSPSAPCSLHREAKELTSAVGLEIGSSVPDLTLVDLDKMVFTLSDVVGERVLLVFSSPDSVFGELYFPKLRTMEDNYPDIRIVMVSKGIFSEKQTLREKYGFDFPILEWTEETAQAYKVPGVPFFYLVDEKGLVENAGFLTDLALLEKALSK